MAAYTVSRWTTFGDATVQAAATLAGLVFVAVSINLNRIVGHPSLPARAWQTLGMFLVPLLTGIFLVLPDESRAVVAWELIISGIIASGYRVAVDQWARQVEKQTPLPLVGRFARFVSSLTPGLMSYACLAIGGTTLLSRSGGGLYWLVPSVLMAFFVGLISAWSLLVGIPPVAQA